MFRTLISVAILGAVVAGCTPRQVTYAEAKEICEDKSRAAAGPQGTVGIGIGTGGTSASVGISISDSFIRGDDPQTVYDTCMNKFLTNGQIIGGTP